MKRINRAPRGILQGFIAALLAATMLLEPAQAKSLYVNKNINGGSPISAYDIQPAPTYLAFQQTSSPTRYGGNGLAIDTDSEILFVTFETYGNLDIVDAKTLVVLGRVTAPSATNLAGIVVDQDKQKVYTVDRSTNHLYVYSWDAAAKTLTNDIVSSPYYVSLPGVSQAHGIALDEVHDILYVGDLTKQIKLFNTASWTSAGTVPVTQSVMGVAVDVAKNLVYSGNAYPPYGSLGLLSKYDMSSGTETTLNVRTLPGGVTSDNVLGLAVDPATNLLYITTGNQGTGGSDRIIVFDSNLSYLFGTGDLGDPTGIVVPGKEISFNPLNLTVDDGVAEDGCVPAGGTITYTICFDNLTNLFGVNNVILEDTLSTDVTFVSATGGGVYDAMAGTVTWSLGSVPAGAPQQCMQLVVQVNSAVAPGSTISNACKIDSDETPPTTKNEYTPVCVNAAPTAEAGGPYSGLEGSPIDFDAGASTDPDGDPLQYRWDFDNDGIWDTAWSSVPTASWTWYDDHAGTVVVEVSDGTASSSDTADVTVNNVPPTILSLTGPTAPVPVGQSVSIDGTYTDPGTLDTHTVTTEWENGAVSGPAAATGGAFAASHTYTEAGVYAVTVTVADDDGGDDTETFEYIVVYDPNAGFVTGGGWITSPAGAFTADPSLTGKATFGFVSKYVKGASIPKGNTEFQFHAGGLNFHSEVYEWLVVTGAKAIYKGIGTIDGAGDYGFLVFAIDGQAKGGDEVDRFRIKIWERASGAIIYDNNFGAGDDVNPTTAIESGQIVIHK